MTTAPLSFSQLQSTWMNAAAGTEYATSAWSSLMASIALAESSGIADNVNATDNGGTQSSYGLWQISTGSHTAPSGNWSDPAANAQLALQKLQSQGLSAWGTYTSGAYQTYLPSGTTLPAGAASGSATGAAAPGAASATTTGISGNPLTWLTAPVKGFEWAGNWITGGTLGSITTEAEGLAGITSGISGLVTMVSKLGQLWLTLMSPAFWLRIGAFVVGISSLFWGFHFLKESL